MQAATAAKAAGAVSELARASFAAGQSPYGVPFGAGRSGKPLTMRRSGKLFAQVRYVAQGTRIRCVLGVPYARYQIRHGLLPTPAEGIPTQWKATIRKIAEVEISVRMRVG